MKETKNTPNVCFKILDRTIKTLLIILAAHFLTSYSHAQELPELETETAQTLLLFYEVDELLSVSFFPTLTSKAPGYSYIITEDQIEKSPARSLRDVIEMRVPGMTTGGHVRHGPLIGTRGIFIDNNAKTMVMLDEQQINKRSQLGYTSGLLSPLLGDMKQVEVILGPGAILHGSGALNGFINLIPKNGKDNPGLFVDSEYGFKEELWKVETGYGSSYGMGKNIYFYAGAYGAEGFEPDELFGSSRTFDINAKGFGEDNYRFSIYWNHDNFNLNTFYYEDNPYKDNSVEPGYFHQATLGVRPKYVFEMSGTDSLELTGSLLWADHSDHRFLTGEPSPLPGVVEGPPLLVGGGAERHWEYKNIYRTRRWDDHALALGFSIGEKRFYEVKQFFSEDAKFPSEALDTKWRELSIFTEDVIAITDRWTASVGLRYDKIDLDEMFATLWRRTSEFNPDNPAHKEPESIKGHYSPRVATAYELDADTTIKGSYQHGFRAPDAAYYRLNLLYRDAAESVGIDFPDLKIETLDSFELNLEKKFPERMIKLNCNAFYNIFEDLLSFQLYKDTGLFTPEEIEAIRLAGDRFPGAIGSFLNERDTIRVRGVEIGMSVRLLNNTEAGLSYGYVKSDAEVVRYPSHQIKLNTLSYFLNNKLIYSLNYLYNSAYSRSDLPGRHDTYRDDRHVVDMALHYEIYPHATVSLTVNNLFENDVPPMVFTPDRPELGGLGYDERRIYLSFELNF